MHKTQIQVNQRHQHKTRYTEHKRKKSGNSLERIATGVSFQNRTVIAQALRTTAKKWVCLKLRSFCKVKDSDNRTKQPTEWEQIFSHCTLTVAYIQWYKELKKPAINKTNNLIKRMGNISKQRNHNRRISNDWETLKEMVNFLSLQGNTNQNNSEFLSYTCQNG